MFGGDYFGKNVWSKTANAQVRPWQPVDPKWCRGRISVNGVFGTTGRKVRLSVSISWIARGPHSSSGDDVRHGEGIAPQQLM
jgi:hypothetical protein